MTPLLPRAALCALAAALAAGACGDDNHPPSLGILLDQQVVVGDSLSLVVTAKDDDGDKLDFSAKGLPPGAQLTQRAPSEAVLSYSPVITDTQPGGTRYDVTIEASDGRGGVARQRFGLIVFPAFGVPSFELPSGVVLNLADTDDLELFVTVKDDDDTDVEIDLDEAPDGATLERRGAKSALLHWRPSDAQREVAVYRAILSAHDGAHAPVTHVLTIVLLHAEKQAGCAGTPPTVRHTVPADAALAAGGFPIEVEATDLDSVVQGVTVHWAVGDGTGAFQAALLAREAQGSPVWRGAVGVPAPAAGGELVHYYFTATDNDDPTGIDCDQTSRTPKSGFYTAAVYPAGGADGVCADDGSEPDQDAASAPKVKPGTIAGRRLCGADTDVMRVAADAGDTVTATVRWEAAHGALTLALRDAAGQTVASDADGGDGELSARWVAGEAQDVAIVVTGARADARIAYAVDVGVDAVECADDPAEPDSSAGGAVRVTEGVYPDRRICPGDSDWAVLAVSPGEAVRIAVAFDAKYGDLDVELRDADGETVLATAASEKSVEELTYRPTRAQDVYVRIYGVAGAQNGYTLTVAGADVAGVCPEDGLGDNHEAEGAVTLFEDVYEGFVTCSGAPDWFVVALNGGERLDLLAQTADGGPAVTIDVFEDPAAAPVASSFQDDDISDVSYTLPGEGALWYRVTTGAATQGYALLQDVTDPPGGCAPDRFEPNGLGAPAAVEPGIYTWARLCGDADVDVYAFEAAPYSLVTVITGHATGGGFTDVKVLAPDGHEVGSAIDEAYGAYVEVPLDEVGGTYRLVVEPYQVGAETLGYDFAIFVD